MPCFVNARMHPVFKRCAAYRPSIMRGRKPDRGSWAPNSSAGFNPPLSCPPFFRSLAVFPDPKSRQTIALCWGIHVSLGWSSGTCCSVITYKTCLGDHFHMWHCVPHSSLQNKKKMLTVDLRQVRHRHCCSHHTRTTENRSYRRLRRLISACKALVQSCRPVERCSLDLRFCSFPAKKGVQRLRPTFVSNFVSIFFVCMNFFFVSSVLHRLAMLSWFCRLFLHLIQQIVTICEARVFRFKI